MEEKYARTLLEMGQPTICVFFLKSHLSWTNLKTITKDLNEPRQEPKNRSFISKNDVSLPTPIIAFHKNSLVIVFIEKLAGRKQS